MTWPLAPLSDALQRIEAGRSPRAQERPAEVGELGVLKLSAISWGEFRPNENKALLPDAEPKGWPRVCAGDLLVSRANTTELIGAVVLVDRDHPHLLLSDKTLRLVPKPEVAHAPFLLYALRGQAARDHIERSATGTSFSMRNISQERIAATPIPLPPFEEQRRIAAILDKADALRAKRRAALAQLDTLTQSIFLEMFGDPTTNPKGWRRGTLGDVATFVGGGTPSRARPEFFEGTICWATSKDIKFEFLDDTQEHITADAIQQSATNLVPAGTVLIVVKSKILAHSLPVAIARVATCFGQDLKGMKVSDRANVSFVTTGLRFGKRWLLERARGINTEGLTLDHLRAFPLPLPPIELQREFDRRVTAVDALKAAQRASLRQLDALFASLQHRAFRGEL